MKKLLLCLALLPLLGASCNSPQQEIACAYNGERYEAGQSFPAEDGCNTCTCGEDGQIGCTEIACPAAQGIDECQVAEDCLDQGIDTSFCSEGEWACINAQCEYSCKIS